MMIDPAIWPKLHGASTHFPVALTMAAAVFEGFALVCAAPRRAQLQAAGGCAVMLGALGTIPAVLSGLIMTKGEVLGHDALFWHHVFVWPSFVLLAGLGLWRARAKDTASRVFYLAALYLTTSLMAAAGYWGGELILNSNSAVETAFVPSPDLIAKGGELYAQSCSHCHGDDATGDEGPDLHHLALSDARIATTIKRGIQGEMPSFAKKYDDRQVAILTAYLHSLR